MSDTEERKQDIEFVLSMIDKLCVSAEIAIIPHTLKDGQHCVAVLDNTTGQKYVITNKKESK